MVSLPFVAFSEEDDFDFQFVRERFGDRGDIVRRCVATRRAWRRGTIGSSSSFVQRTSFVQNRFGEDSLLERTDANELSHLPPPGTKLGEEPQSGTIGTSGTGGDWCDPSASPFVSVGSPAASGTVVTR